MSELRVLGDVDLRGADGARVDSIVAQPKSLALLVYLCLAAQGRPQKRDLLIFVFWPELSETNARNALNQSLYRLRQALGTGSIRSHGTGEVGIDPTELSCDALDFLAALDTGNLQAALDLYRGDLLMGLFVSGAPDFERWLEGERTSLRRKAFDGALELGQAAEERNDPTTAVRWYERATAIRPESGVAVRHLMTVLARTGNAAEAVQVFDRFAARLVKDYGLQPSEETRAVVESIRSASNTRGEVPDGEWAEAPRAGTADTSTAPEVVETGVPPDALDFGSGRSWRVGVTLFLGAAVVTAGALLVSGGWPGRGSLQITVSNMTHVTSDPGLEFQPAISPDGSEVAYVEGPIGQARIVVRSTRIVGGEGASRPGAEESGNHGLPAWTPDGSSLRFLASSCGSGWDWKEVGKFGGSVRTISRPFPGNNRLSPDGSLVVFVRGDSIFSYAADHGEPELLGVHVDEPSGLHSLSWSPDGRRIAYVNGNSLWRGSANVAPASIWILDTDSGRPVRVTDDQHLNVSPQWLPDSRHLLFVSDRDGTRAVYVVEVAPDGPLGPPRSVPGPADSHSISVSADGRRLAHAKFAVVENIWSIPIPRSGPVSIRDKVPVTTGNQVVETQALSPDGEWIVFSSNIGGGFDVYKQRVTGGQPELIVDLDFVAFATDWSPDGAEITFSSGAEVFGADVFVVQADGGTPKQLTDFPGREGMSAWSPDGRVIAFNSEGPDGVSRPQNDREIWSVSRDGVGHPWGDPVQLTDFGCSWPDWDPDGTGLLCTTNEGWALVSADGEVLARFNASDVGLRNAGYPMFSPDGSSIFFWAVEEDCSEGFWRTAPTLEGATKVVAIDDPLLDVFFKRVSVGAEALYFTIAEYESDIWVMDLDW